MRILAFETSAKAASVALLEDDTLLGELYLNCGLTHSRTLLESAQRLLEITELTAKDIDAVACAAGPGSFTGVRIGVAAAKGFAWGRDIPCCGVSTLEAMAWQALEFSGIVCCAMDARPRRERHTDTPVPRLRRFTRRGAARTGKLRKTENNGWRWRTVVL